MDSGARNPDPWIVPPVLVSCCGCGFQWHSASMAHGLRVAGSCVRCGGELEFADGAGVDAPDDRLQVLRGIAPHLALGVGALR